MKSLKRMSSKSKTHLLMIIPVVVLFFAFNTLPLIIGAFYSFTNYRGYGSWDFVGLRNYIDLFSRMQIEQLLLEDRPTMLFVEHDKAFREKVATRRVTL